MFKKRKYRIFPFPLSLKGPILQIICSTFVSVTIAKAVANLQLLFSGGSTLLEQLSQIQCLFISFLTTCYACDFVYPNLTHRTSKSRSLRAVFCKLIILKSQLSTVWRLKFLLRDKFFKFRLYRKAYSYCFNYGTPKQALAGNVLNLIDVGTLR